ncbi:MAG: RagB/SusD protein [Segetibacter sp.]|nr:RagB/SusD protein [Segetibacter sp.]
MKKYLIALLLLSVVSCKKDLLDKAPYGVQTDDSYFKTSADLDKTLIAAYSTLQGPPFYSYTVAQFVIGDMGSDDAVDASFDPAMTELSVNQQKSTNAHIKTYWSQSYNGIAMSNLVIDKQSVVSGNAEDIKKIAAQAKFLRAFYYYHLVIYFGDVPMPLTYLDPARVDLARTPKAQVLAQIQKDLTEAAAVLPTKSAWGSANDGRATSGAALSLLGKAYMFDKKFPEAAAAFKKVIDESSYSLLTDYGAIFRKTGDYNNAESIFDIKHKANVPGGNPGFSAEGTSFFIYQWPYDAGGYNVMEGTQDLVTEFEKGDPRAIYTLIFAGDVFLRAGSSNYKVAPNRKNRKSFIPHPERTANSPNDEAKSLHVVRYAEILLLYAEALNENGKPAEALIWLNKVRERARNTPSNDPQRVSTTFDLSYTGTLLPDVTTTDKTALQKAIWHEQRVELAMEEHRREYLVRTNQYKVRMETAKSQIGVANITADDLLLPIPASEVDLSNGVITQNKGY